MKEFNDKIKLVNTFTNKQKKTHTKYANNFINKFANLFHYKTPYQNIELYRGLLDEYNDNETIKNYFNDSNFMSDKIRKAVFDNYKFLHKYRLNIQRDGVLMTIFFYYMDTKPVHNGKKLNEFIQFIVDISCGLYLIKNETDEMEFSFYYVPTKFKKCLPKNNKLPIDSHHVNTGVTFLSEPRHVFIYRQEEQYKVSLHELIHCFDIDMKVHSAEIDHLVGKIFPVCDNEPIYIYETYTEFVAILLYHSYFALKENKGHIKNSVNIFTERIRDEVNFSFYQMLKILNFYNFPMKTLTSNKESNICIPQKTNVISYYFLKLICLYSWTDSLDFIQKHSYYGFLDYKDSDTMLFVKYIIHDLFNKDFNNKLNKCNKVYIKQKFDKSLRMCYYNN